MFFQNVTSVKGSLPNLMHNYWVDQLDASYRAMGFTDRRGSRGSRAYIAARHAGKGGKPFEKFFQLSPSYKRFMTKDSADFMEQVGQYYVGLDETDVDPLFASEHNGQMVTHTEDKKLRAIEQGAIKNLFASDNPNDWPELVLTASHALARDERDVVDIMRGFHNLINNSGGIEELNLIREPEKAKGKKHGGKVVIAAAVDASENAWLNGAKLIRRCSHVRETSMRGDDGDEMLRENGAYLDHISPAAERLGEQMLSVLCDNTDEGRKLRSNVEALAEHITLVGYSRGGNIVSDAVRYLTSQLIHAPIYSHETGEKLTRDEIEAVVSKINVLAIAVARHESPLTETEKDYGMTRTNLVNNYDRVASPFDPKKYDHDPHRDLIIPVDGDKKGAGHDPISALGLRGDFGEAIEGYYTQNPDVRERLGEIFEKHHACARKPSVGGGKPLAGAELPAMHDGVLGSAKKGLGA